MTVSSGGVYSCFLGHLTIETAFPFQKHSHSGYWRWFGFCFGFFFFHLLPINEGENELDFLEGKKKKSSLPHNIPPQHFVSEHSLQPLTGCIAQSHRTAGAFPPLFFPSIAGFIIDHNAPTTSAVMSLSPEESRPLGQPLQSKMATQKERRLCGERGPTCLSGDRLTEPPF